MIPPTPDRPPVTSRRGPGRMNAWLAVCVAALVTATFAGPASALVTPSLSTAAAAASGSAAVAVTTDGLDDLPALLPAMDCSDVTALDLRAAAGTKVTITGAGRSSTAAPRRRTAR